MYLKTDLNIQNILIIQSNDNKLLLAAIMANCKHESAHFNACKERLASKDIVMSGKKVNSKTCLCDLNKAATGYAHQKEKQIVHLDLLPILEQLRRIVVMEPVVSGVIMMIKLLFICLGEYEFLSKTIIY